MLTRLRASQIWTNLVPRKLDAYMGNSTLATSAYTNPLGFIKIYAVGTPERNAVARAQDETQVRDAPPIAPILPLTLIL